MLCLCGFERCSRWVPLILQRNPTEGNLCSLGWGEGLSSKDIKLLRSARKEKETPSYFLSSEVTFAFAAYL